MELSEILTWLVPMVAGALLAFLTSMFTTKMSHKNQLEREEQRDTRNREWALEDQQRKRQREIFDNNINGINNYLNLLTDSLRLFREASIGTGTGSMKTNQQVREIYENARSKLLSAHDIHSLFYTIDDTELEQLGLTMFQILSGTEQFFVKLVEKLPSGGRADLDSSEYKLFDQLSNDFDKAKTETALRITKLSKQYY